MQEPTRCEVDGCDRPRAGRQRWCRAHVQRVRRTGSTGPAEFRRAPGSPIPECSHEGCADPVRSRGLCAAHYQRQYQGLPLDGLIRHYQKKPPPPCKIEGCDDVSDSRGWCRRHYLRWWRTGDPGPAELRRYGLFEVCSAEGCDRPHRTKGFCEMHYRRWKRGVRPGSLNWTSEPRWHEGTTYAAAHQQMRAERGPATGYQCIGCGGRAQQWAYQHNDPNALLSQAGMPYSLNFYECYEPMCLSCHGRLDKDRDERAARGGRASA